MIGARQPEITFGRLTDVSRQTLVTHMSDPRVAVHMPLLERKWTLEDASNFVDLKERHWCKHALGHWAFFADQRYLGWGGFQKEGDEWDYGLVLTPDSFGLGLRITRLAVDFAKADQRIPYITFLLPPSRSKLRALARLGADYVGDVQYEATRFLKYRLATA